MLFGLTMFPIGDGNSLRRPVAEVIDEIDRAGLQYEVSGMDTVIEGTWDQVIPVIRDAERRLREAHGRVFMLLTMDDNSCATSQLRRSAIEVEQELGRHVPHADG
jgi:uncharacterized protein YqgV (UPF0045/DUF77 family)